MWGCPLVDFMTNCSLWPHEDLLWINEVSVMLKQSTEIQEKLVFQCNWNKKLSDVTEQLFSFICSFLSSFSNQLLYFSSCVTFGEEKCCVSSLRRFQVESCDNNSLVCVSFELLPCFILTAEICGKDEHPVRANQWTNEVFSHFQSGMWKRWMGNRCVFSVCCHTGHMHGVCVWR